MLLELALGGGRVDGALFIFGHDWRMVRVYETGGDQEQCVGCGVWGVECGVCCPKLYRSTVLHFQGICGGTFAAESMGTIWKCGPEGLRGFSCLNVGFIGESQHI